MKHSVLKLSGDVAIDVIEGLTRDQAADHLVKISDGREYVDEPFYICDLGDVAEKYETWLKLFPRIRPFYAIKVGPHEPMIASLAVMGAGFECAGKKEIDMAIRNGASLEDIIYGNPYKQTSHLRHAKEVGVKTTVVDSFSELHKIRNVYPTADILLRIKVRPSSYPEQFVSMIPGVSATPPERFGATLDQSRHLIKEAREMKLKIIGISFHVGSFCTDMSIYTDALRQAKELFIFAENLGMQFSVLDIGGGFPDPEIVNKALDELFPVEEYKSLRVVAEPGRYIPVEAFTLATIVLAKSETNLEGEAEVEYTVSDGKHGALRYVNKAGYGTRLPFVLNATERKNRFAKIWGPSMDKTDMILEKFSLPELEVGDWMLWASCGAYTYADSGEFNGMRTKDFYNIISVEKSDVFERVCGRNIR